MSLSPPFWTIFQVLQSLGLPNFSGSLNWKNSPKKEVDALRNLYMSTYKFYREKIHVAERNGHNTEKLWEKLEKEPFLSWAKFQNILSDFGPQTRTAGKEP